MSDTRLEKIGKQIKDNITGRHWRDPFRTKFIHFIVMGTGSCNFLTEEEEDVAISNLSKITRFYENCTNLHGRLCSVEIRFNPKSIRVDFIFREDDKLSFKFLNKEEVLNMKDMHTKISRGMFNFMSNRLS